MYLHDHCTGLLYIKFCVDSKTNSVDSLEIVVHLYHLHISFESSFTFQVF